jgi:tRNA(Ile)-lysidine synthase
VLEVAGPAAGARLRPLGTGGSKLVADALAEAGVPPARRATWPVVRDADGTVLWVVGYRVDDRVRVRHGTRRFLWLSAEEPGAEEPGAEEPGTPCEDDPTSLR